MAWPNIVNHRILITGGQGFIGRYLAGEILKSRPRAEVLTLGRSHALPTAFTHYVTRAGNRIRAPLPEDLRHLESAPGHTYRQVDLANHASVAALVKEFKPQAIYHLASALRGEPTAGLINNILIVESLLEAVAESGLRGTKVVLVSSGAVYGPRPPNTPRVSERSKPNPVDVYAATKLASEHVASVIARSNDLDVCIARVFNVVGPGQDERHIAGSLGSQIAAIEAQLVPPRILVGPLVTTRDFIDVRDVAKALTCLARAGKPGGVYNVASGIETPIQSVFDLIVAMSASDATPSVKRLTQRRDDNQRVQVDVSRLRSLGFQASFPLQKSLSDVLSYYRSDVKTAVDRNSRRRMTAPALSGGDHGLRVQGELPFGYSVEVARGLLDLLPFRFADRYRGRTLALLTDAKVMGLFGRRLVDGLRAQGLDVVELEMARGERAKSMESFQAVIQQLYDARFDRRGILVCLGGGVVTDVGGFVAASYMRGVSYVNVPTTLMAQCDAAIGGKVALNMPWAKNFVGAFHHPEGVFCDPLLLETLEDRQVSSGVAENIKAAIIGDPILFDVLERHSDAIMQDRDPHVFTDVIQRAVHVKVRLLEPDPYERDLRRALNFGHSIGHALETHFGYEQIEHGEAVSYGMAVASEYARLTGAVSDVDARRIQNLIGLYGMPPSVPTDVADAIMTHMNAIRLIRGRQLSFVVPEGIGSIRILDEIDPGILRQAIESTRGTILSPGRGC